MRRSFFLSLLPALAASTPTSPPHEERSGNDHQVLILGAGVSGIIAARELHAAGVQDFKILEARDEIGGRLQSVAIGEGDKKYVVEKGANWVQGTQEGSGPTNPIWTLVKKHGVKTVSNDWSDILTYDHTGYVDYKHLFDQSTDAYTALTNGAGSRVDRRLVDTTARTGYALTGWKPVDDHQAAASEYYQFDWEYAQTPEQSSWIASSWGNNFTYTPPQGFGGDNLMSQDQRGFKHFIQAEAKEFLKDDQVLYNKTVENVEWGKSGVKVHLKGGEVISADRVLVTFSLGVLQNDDVKWTPKLPDWKEEAIQSMSMATYTKIFFQFPNKFWGDSEMALYADPTERGRYPVWQSLDHPDFFPGSGIYFVTITGDFSERIESLPDDTVKSEVLGVLRSMFPNTTIPDPTAFYFPRWHKDPLFRGSYSNWPSSFFPQHADNLRASVGEGERVWFAGEATSWRYFGFLHGAYEQGQLAGKALAKCVTGSGCAYVSDHKDVPICAPKYPE